MIVLTSTGPGLDARPSPSFGRCPYLLLIEPQTNAVVPVPNPASQLAGGAGVVAAQLVVDRGAEAVITGRVGPYAMGVLSAAGVGIYDLGEDDAWQAIADFQAGKLHKITAAGEARSGGR